MDSEGNQEDPGIDRSERGGEGPAPVEPVSSPAAEDSSPTPVAPTDAASGRPVEKPSRTGNWNPLFIVGALLILIVASLVLINHFQAKKSTSAVPTTAPLATQPPVSTPTIKGGAVAAVVNGHKIPTSKYRILLNLSARRGGAAGASVKTLASQALNQTIVYELVRQYAQAHHLTVTAKDVGKETATIEASNGGAKHFPAFLKSLGLTTASYNYLVSSQILEQKVAAKVAPAKPLGFAHVRHILIAPAPPSKGKNFDAVARAKANKIAQELRNGGSWTTLARKNSIDTQSGTHGGDLGNVYQGTTVPPFNRAIFGIPIGKITVIHSQFGYHVLEVLARGKGVPPAASTSGRAQQQKAFAAWLRNQMKSAKIKKLVTVG